ncbi:MAG TPA: double-strand break repair helicase AddA [Acetobacteraceae bacterium]|nr:double-strand break repair helicase AddA [Acetobacteraceae bacterium]
MSAALSARAHANVEQLRASDPAVSAFVGASAGSGKTKLLTDRLLRLMLAGAAPERIQCLTFTKAAAAEMAVRLQRTLGRWVTLDDDALGEELAALVVEPTPATRACARALFARVLDLPGGMRIGTIHAFCQSLLRRFPLEAALSPHFRLVDERDAEDTLTEARETMLGRASGPAMRAALETLAGLTSANQFGAYVADLQRELPRLAGALALGDSVEAAQRRALGVQATSEDEVIATAVNWQEEPQLRAAAQIVRKLGARGCAERADRILAWLTLEETRRVAGWQGWCDEFLTKAGGARAASQFVSKAVTDAHPDLCRHFHAECDRIIAALDACAAYRVARVSAALVTLAAPVLRAYAEHKESAGLLDYDDLIDRTSNLLVDPGAAWVLYKLDGGLDHLLLDEVQDTAPEQWRIASGLTAEFFAGETGRDAHRTVFAVGDRKQSIYSFQGADVDAFDASRRMLRERVQGAGRQWRDAQLDVSFRSTAPVLELVDQVFADPAAQPGVVEPGQVLGHHADRADHAGSVELWPLTPLPDVPEPQPWAIPEQNQGLASAPQRLAETLAQWIAQQTGGGTMLESKGRPLTPGDVMVLVRRRNDFGRALVRALKSLHVPVAGLDRLVLTDQPAVQDLVALADALLLPQDDLTFACFLTSPLGGLSDESLMELAVGRGGAALWETLRARAGERPEWGAAWSYFEALLGRVDYVAPHALLAEALGPLGGRARLFARLGPEAAEPVDELLNAALAHGRMHPISLQGFLHWLRRSGAEVKREAESAGGLVRVMTVHGAKGLEAPLVILPDTTSLPPDDLTILWAADPATRREVPIWSPRREFRCDATRQLRDGATRRRLEEHNRLLYVALTRAQDRLLVCGWDTKRGPDDACWYRLVERGFDRLPAERTGFGAWDGEARRYATPQRARAERALGGDPPASVPLPHWAGQSPAWRAAPPSSEPGRLERLAPSRPENIELGPVPAAATPLSAREAANSRFRRGSLLHALLQHLPNLPPPEREVAALAWLERPGSGLAAGESPILAREVLAILDHPDLAPLFGPDSRAEVPLTGVVGGAVVGGLVDRLAVLDDRVLVADYKTNRNPPEKVEDTPMLYRRQMGAYRAVLRQIFPDKPVACALVWTQSAQVVMLPDELLDLPSAAPT